MAILYAINENWHREQTLPTLLSSIDQITMITAEIAEIWTQSVTVQKYWH